MLKALLAATAPEAFAGLSARVHTELRLAAALVRRFLFALAREMQVPPRHHYPAAKNPSANGQSAPRTGAAFRLFEPVSPRHNPGPRPPPSGDSYIEWALALQRVQMLLAAMRAPEPLARRIAVRLARGAPPRLRDLPVPAFVLRRIAPAFDILLMRLDALARPDAWAGIDPDTG